MKMIAFLLAATLVGLIKGQTDCDYDYVCDDKGSQVDLVMLVDSPLGCYEACNLYDADNNAATQDCLFWTYYEELGFKTFVGESGTELDGIDAKTKATKIASCRMVPDCGHQISNADCETGIRTMCASGPGSCQACDVCPPLAYSTGATKAHWTCDIDMPYRKTGIAPDTWCSTECPSSLWTNPYVTATCTSTCPTGSTGEWVLDPTTATDGTVPIDPAKDSDCFCEDIILEPHQIPDFNGGATSEEGARFYCKSPGLVTGNTMDSTTRCQLFCNGHIAMDIRCVAGAWTDGVVDNSNIYCWGAPLDCDYNPGINMDVCTCTGATGPTICAAEQGCNDGTCLDACVDASAAGADGCFCETKTGGIVCAVGETCTDGVCAV